MILRRTKLRPYETLVVPVLSLYGCETWKMDRGDNKAVDEFHNLPRILRIQLQEYISNKKVLDRADMKCHEVRRWSNIDGRWQDTF